MSLHCTKAIIAVGGFGTRWLPITKAIEKCMLPVGSRPVVDYLVEDCLKAGITDIYFVVAEQSEQIRTFYGSNDRLYQYLKQKGKLDELNSLKQLSSKATFHFVVQNSSVAYGTAVPVMLCQRFIKPDERAVVLMGDQFVYNPDGSSEVAHLLREVEASNVTAGMIVAPVPKEEVHKYGIVEVGRHHGRQFFKRIVEKPSVQEAPGRLSNLGIYVFDHDLLDCLRHVKPTQGEYYLTDALSMYVQKLRKQLAVVTAKGEYLDCGTVEGWLRTNQYMLQHHVLLTV